MTQREQMIDKTLACIGGLIVLALLIGRYAQ
jgi:hypothetical protein